MTTEQQRADARINQDFAEQRDPQWMGAVRYSQTLKGWSGAGFDSSFRVIEGGYNEKGNFTEIKFEVIDTIGKRNYSKLGQIVLRETDAIALALAIAPPSVAKAYTANAALIAEMLKQEMVRTKECIRLREVLAEIAAIKKPQMCMDGSAVVGSPNATGYDYQHIARAALAAAGAV